MTEGSAFIALPITANTSTPQRQSGTISRRPGRELFGAWRRGSWINSNRSMTGGSSSFVASDEPPRRRGWRASAAFARIFGCRYRYLAFAFQVATVVFAFTVTAVVFRIHPAAEGGIYRSNRPYYPTKPETEAVVTSTAVGTKTKSRKIPHNLIFTGKDNILETKSPQELYDNVMRNIRLYNDAFNNNDDDESGGGYNSSSSSQLLSNVHFLTDNDCRRIIEEVTTAPPPPGRNNTKKKNGLSKLLAIFDKERVGMFRGDICRIAALYKHGGYYLDLDIKTLTPYVVGGGGRGGTRDGSGDDSKDGDYSFVTVAQTQDNRPVEQAPFFQAFIASTAGHPILKRALEVTMIEYYERHPKYRKYKFGSDHMGTITLSSAYYEVLNIDANNNGGSSNVTAAIERSGDGNNDYHLLEEINIGSEPEWYGNVTRQEGKGCCCNYIVHDPIRQTPYFFSRAGPLEINRRRGTCY